jgi:hypothetical protein
MPNTARVECVNVAVYSVVPDTLNTISDDTVEYTVAPVSASSVQEFEPVFRFTPPVADTPSGILERASVLYPGRSAVASMMAFCHVYVGSW